MEIKLHQYVSILILPNRDAAKVRWFTVNGGIRLKWILLSKKKQIRSISMYLQHFVKFNQLILKILS